MARFVYKMQSVLNIKQQILTGSVTGSAIIEEAAQTDLDVLSRGMDDMDLFAEDNDAFFVE